MNNEEGGLITRKDYQAILNDNGDNSFNPLVYSRTPEIQPGSNNLFNGNIKKMVTAMRISETKILPSQVNKYRYDQLNRIYDMTSSAVINKDDSFSDSYQSEYRYDKNGNIEKATALLTENKYYHNAIVDGKTPKPASGDLANFADGGAEPCFLDAKEVRVRHNGARRLWSSLSEHSTA